ncbi:hypothetical protein P43SY_005131 [Pythium insidiosum]|uniref:Protein kinase domain-containing protein n=1 Tax=Pythium insidiosum TaxID=114742 RepID=A0AAD5LXX6_PYTIN|nr:hypothetical protein P43SY_005131 [Pythium insidiosum]
MARRPLEGKACKEDLEDSTAQSPEGVQCFLHTGVSFVVLNSPPSSADVAALCPNKDCEKTVATLARLAPEECVLNDALYLHADFVRPLQQKCGWNGAAPSNATGSASSPPTTAPPQSTSTLTFAPVIVATSPTPVATPPQATTPTPTTEKSSTAQRSDASVSGSENNGITGGALAAIVVGAIVGAGVVAFVVAKLTGQRRLRSQSAHDSSVGGSKSYAALNKTTTATSSQGSAAMDPAAVIEATLSYGAIAASRIPFERLTVSEVPLSRGGFGEVFRGVYQAQPVVIKRLLPDRRRDMQQISAFASEIRLLSSLEHERIVRFVGAAWDSLAELCVVVEFMAGGDLRSTLSRFARDQRATGFDADKRKIALHVAHALTYLHSLQPTVLHRDLKSKNVLLTETLDAKLTDFGASREQADHTMTAGVGSSLWMAPEVMLGERYDAKADVFSFGVLLSELDTHELPYAHAVEPTSGRRLPETAVLQLVSLGRLHARFSDSADTTMVAIARDCLEMDPLKRPSAAELLHRIHSHRALES